MKVSVYIATSLDGFIAREDGSLDWLPAPEPGGEAYGYRAFMSTVDTVVLGRATYDTMLGFGEWPYGERRVVVLSHRPLPEAGPAPGGRVERLSGQPTEIVSGLRERGAGHVYLDGGRAIQGFLASGLVSRLIVTRVPVLLGSGRALFGPLVPDLRLRHLGTRAYPDGLVQSEYEPAASRRIRLEPVREEHAAAFQPLLEDPEVSDHTPLPFPYPPDGAIQFAARAVGLQARGAQYSFAICDALAGPVGVTLLKDVHAVPGEAELGYWIGRPYWGGGRASAAAAATVEFAFATLGLQALTAVCVEANLASIRVLAALGFTRTGGMMQDDPKWAAPRPSAVLRLTREAWARQGGERRPFVPLVY